MRLFHLSTSRYLFKEKFKGYVKVPILADTVELIIYKCIRYLK